MTSPPMTRRSAVALMGGLALGTAGRAQAPFPARPIRLVVPFEPGGTIDALGRAVAAQITRQSGIDLYVDNKPGANAVIGTVEVAKAAPDGHTVLCVSPSIVLNPAMKARQPYELAQFAPVTALGIGSGYLLVTRLGLPAKSLDELVALARRRENGVSYGSPGIGNAIHIGTEAFAREAGIRMLHVPYKGSAGALNAIVAGQVDVMMLSPAAVVPLAAGRKLSVLAFTGDARSPEFPDVPTLKEAGLPALVIKGTWAGWFVPAGTPQPVVARLHQEVGKALKDARVAQTLAEGGFVPDGRPPGAFARFVHDESQRLGEIVKAIGLNGQG